MNAALLDVENFELDDAIVYRNAESPRLKRDASAKTKFAARARYRRGKCGSSFNGAHRRRDKRSRM